MKILKIVSYLIIILLNITIVSCNKDNSSSGTDSNNDNRIPIGVTLPLTGGGPIDIQSHQLFVEMAVEDINQYFKDHAIDMQVKAEIKDSENSPVGIYNAIFYFNEKGINYIASAGTSQNIYDMEQEINSNPFVLIHSSSTAPVLAKEDNIFRIIPNDNVTAEQIANKLETDGIQNIVIFYRDDVWGTNLNDKVRELLETKSIAVESISYFARLIPESIEEVIPEAESKIEDILKQSTPAKTAFLVLAFSEISNILKISDRTKKLFEINWYGADGFVMNNELINDSEVAPLAEQVKMICPTIAENHSSSRFMDVKDRITRELNYTPRANSFLIYDAFWAAAIAKSKDMAQHIEAVKTAISESDFICGPIIFDENGDRTTADYEFIRIIERNSTYDWEILK